MAKRKEDPPKGGSPAWMSTFSDLMNLLLCFFVLLFASSTIDAEKLQQVAASFAKDNIFQAGSTAIGEGHMVSSGVKQLTVLDNYVNSLGRNQKGSSSNLSDVKEEAEKVISAESTTAEQMKDESTETKTTESQEATTASNATTEAANVSDAEESDDKLEKKLEESGYKQSSDMAQEIEKMLKSSQIEKQVSLEYNAQYVLLSLNGGILFESGAADLKSDAEPLVSKVGDILVKYRKRTIEIEGHTDNIPVSNGEFKSNQYLSSARAISVYEFLMQNKNLIPANVKHSGYGDARPKASNSTAKGRAKNRRVEIKIYNKLNSEEY